MGGDLPLTLKLSVLVLLLVKLDSVLTQTLYSPPGLVRVIITTVGVTVDCQAPDMRMPTELITTLHDAAADHKRRVIS